MRNSTEQPFVVYIDDDEDDRMLFNDAFREAYPDMTYLEFAEAMKALDYLQQEKANGRLPRHIVVDVNMPVMDGYEFTKELRKDEAFMNVPLTYFSTSQRPTFLLLNTGTTFYRQKPAEFSAYTKLIKEMLGEQQPSSVR